jgi:hypothetical protein
MTISLSPLCSQLADGHYNRTKLGYIAVRSQGKPGRAIIAWITFRKPYNKVARAFLLADFPGHGVMAPFGVYDKPMMSFTFNFTHFISMFSANIAQRPFGSSFKSIA